MAENQVRFVRINGRIVPIRSKQGENKKGGQSKAVGGAIVGSLLTVGGAHAGAGIGMSTQRKKFERLARTVKKLGYKEPVPFADKFAEAAGVKGVKVVTSAQQASDFVAPLGPKAQAQARNMTRFMDYMGGGFAVSTKKLGRGVFVKPAGSPSILAHELGHIKDFQKRNSHPRFYQRGFLGRLSGSELRMEKRAWDLAPDVRKTMNVDGVHMFSKTREGVVQTEKMKKFALATYKIAQRSSRIGAATGTLAGLGASYAFLKGSAVKKKKR